MQTNTHNLPSGCIYVLVPLPSHERAECTPACGYIRKNALQNGALSKKIFTEIIKLGSELHGRVKIKHPNTHPTLLTFADTDILQSLTAQDTLYIVAHGSPTAIGSLDDSLNLTPQLLVQELKTAKLSPELRTLKLMACNTALDAKNLHLYSYLDRSYKYTSFYEKKSFAENVRNVFQAQSISGAYSQLDIVGYLGEVADVTKAKNKRDYHSLVKFGDCDNPSIRASESRLFFLGSKTKRDVEEIKDCNDSTLALLDLTNRR